MRRMAELSSDISQHIRVASVEKNRTVQKHDHFAHFQVGNMAKIIFKLFELGCRKWCEKPDPAPDSMFDTPDTDQDIFDMVSKWLFPYIQNILETTTKKTFCTP